MSDLDLVALLQVFNPFFLFQGAQIRLEIREDAEMKSSMIDVYYYSLLSYLPESGKLRGMVVRRESWYQAWYCEGESFTVCEACI